MKSKEELNKEAQKLFEQHKTDKIFATSDGQFFFEKNRAKLHANSKKLIAYEFENEGMQKNEQKTEDVKANSIKLLMSTENIATLGYDILKKTAMCLELRLDNLKQETIIDALNKMKEELKSE